MHYSFKFFSPFVHQVDSFYNFDNYHMDKSGMQITKVLGSKSQYISSLGIELPKECSGTYIQSINHFVMKI